MSVACSKCGETHENWVPLDKLEAQTLKKKEALAAAEKAAADLTAARAEWDAAQKDTATRLAGLDATAKELADLKAAQASWSTERAFLSAGITDPEGIDFATHAWNRLPADARPASVGDWLADAEKLPKGVRSYLPTMTDPAAPAAPAKAPAPGVNDKTKPTPSPTAGRTAADISRMSMADFQNEMPAILASVGAAPAKA
jgi:hypothetical protein